MCGKEQPYYTFGPRLRAFLLEECRLDDEFFSVLICLLTEFAESGQPILAIPSVRVRYNGTGGNEILWIELASNDFVEVRT